MRSCPEKYGFGHFLSAAPLTAIEPPSSPGFCEEVGESPCGDINRPRRFTHRSFAVSLHDNFTCIAAISLAMGAAGTHPSLSSSGEGGSGLARGESHEGTYSQTERVKRDEIRRRDLSQRELYIHR